MTTKPHLCLGVGADQCCDCGVLRFVLIELRFENTSCGTALVKVRDVIAQTPGIELSGEMVVQSSFLDDGVDLTAIVRITDRKALPEEHHPDPQDGPSVTGGILDAIWEHVEPAAGSAGWVRTGSVHEWLGGDDE